MTQIDVKGMDTDITRALYWAEGYSIVSETENREVRVYNVPELHKKTILNALNITNENTTLSTTIKDLHDEIAVLKGELQEADRVTLRYREVLERIEESDRSFTFDGIDRRKKELTNAKQEV